jgi:hypothetical protein
LANLQNGTTHPKFWIFGNCGGGGLAGLYHDNQTPESALFPSQGLRIGSQFAYMLFSYPGYYLGSFDSAFVHLVKENIIIFGVTSTLLRKQSVISE